MTDVLSIILLVAGIILGFLALIKAFGNKSTLVGIVGIVVLIFGFLGFVGAIDYSALSGKQTTQQFTAANFNQPIPTQKLSSCAPQAITSNGLSQADVLYRNAENTTGIGYIAAAVSANSQGSFIASTTTNAGGSGTGYVSMSTIPNCGVGELVATVTTGTGVASSRKVTDVEKKVSVTGYDFTDKAAHKYEVVGASGDVVNIQARDSALALASSGNLSGSAPFYAISGTGTADSTAYFLNTSLGAKGSINFYIDVRVNGTASAFGAYEEPDGVVISYDTQTASVFTSNSLDLQSDVSGWSLTKLGSCPVDIISNRNVEACWSAPSMKAGKLYRIKGTLVADGGDPTVEAKPTIFFDDKVFFRDIDGQIKYQSFSSSGGTNQGVGGTSLQFVLS